MLAIEVGLSIDLGQAAAALKGAGWARLPAGRNPAGLDWSSPPLTLEQDGPPIEVAGRRVAPVVQVRVFDFGAVSITYRIPFAGAAATMLELSTGLSNNQALTADGRARAQALLAGLDGAVRKPGVSAFVEDYAVFVVDRVEGGAASSALAAIGEPAVAGILRAEAAPLGEQEVRDCLSASVSYGPGDLAVIDWNAALLLDAEPQATLDVLEFANVELLEYRALDAQLDAALAESWRAVLDRRGPSVSFRAGHRELQRLAALQMDAALLYEEISNALKLLGDQFLARLYRAANRRMHLDEWERSTLRKLETLESIYEKLADKQAHRRAELLEWIIIVLISAEIVFSVVTFLRN
jgi:hypothetical protein